MKEMRTLRDLAAYRRAVCWHCCNEEDGETAALLRAHADAPERYARFLCGRAGRTLNGWTGDEESFVARKEKFAAIPVGFVKPQSATRRTFGSLASLRGVIPVRNA
jgi:hypothetical protein